MAKATPKKDPNALAEVAGNVFAGIMAVFTFVVLAVFPLYYHNYYFDILKAKYKFYWITVVAMAVICLIVALVFLFVDRMEYDGVNTKRFFSHFRFDSLKKQPAAYKFLILFLILAAISTLLSDYKFESFWGNEGRFSGLFLISLYALGVFMIGKLGKIKKWYLDLFLLSGVLVCLFGITDYFRMDLLHWKAGVTTTQADSFTSTLGNINTYTAYVALVLGVACGLFTTEKNIFRNIWYFIVLLIGFFAIITGQSDNAYLALGAVFALFPLALFATRKGIIRYITVIASFMSVIKVIDEINKKMAEKVIGLSGIFDVLVRHKYLEVIVIALWLLVAVLYIGDRVLMKDKEDKVGKWLRITWFCLIAAGVAAVIAVLYDANFGPNPEKYSSLSGYLVFNDSWGTNRGYCWRIGWESYMQQPLIHKLFGFGPDTFGILTWPFRQDSLDTYGVFFESAHNEYFQYLVTMGPFTMIAYILFLVSSCARMFRYAKVQPWILAPLGATVCYGAQALVNINLPIATPVMWALLAVGLAMCKNASETAKGSDKQETAVQNQ
ncbi:O-antigen ligase family protein [[Clostridium] symbiosum]|uniref:O-antigen ligase family protein n=1 Tax=Clostridium symbiosum TaxID=1512 RepID=UPI001D05DDED|nr:O-antigen ligase family protein [[Clostridium] symbiosum]MCB6611169.1 O-antigen ligase family protein [[Clostridium] symbiosum]MCB6930326.1 O-antigen ligase family protein [[Clostridium] symbiosum]